jgi:TRAP-type mannitol/chloroaromatic compound transport system substrate-binding protein
MKRRVFLFFLVVVIIASTFNALSCRGSSSADFKWRMAASFTEDNLYYSKCAQAICDRVRQLSNGRLIIEPFPAGKLAEAFGVFDAVSSGQVEVGYSWPGYWSGKDPSFELFSSIPNNMVQSEWSIWLYGPSKGIDLWRELYIKYNLVPFPGGLTGAEFGIFTNKPLRTLNDFKGVRIRMPGMGAEVLKELGGIPVTIPQGQIKEALGKGEIDGFEYSTPAIDWMLGFDSKITPYVTLPSWHQPSAIGETIVNKDAWNRLPDDLKAIFEAVCKEVSMVDFLGYMEGLNAVYIQRYSQGGIQILELDTAAMKEISKITERLADSHAGQNSFYAKVLQSQREFRASYRVWEKWNDPRVYAGN